MARKKLRWSYIRTLPSIEYRNGRPSEFANDEVLKRLHVFHFWLVLRIRPGCVYVDHDIWVRNNSLFWYNTRTSTMYTRREFLQPFSSRWWNNVSVTNTHVYYLVVSLNTSEENALNNQAMLESDYRSTPKELITWYDLRSAACHAL